MYWLTWLAALSAPAPPPVPPVGTDPAAESTDAGRTVTAIDVIELEDERFERMTVPVTIMGQGPFRFIIDTGAQATVISHALAEQLALGERRVATLVGMNSIRSVETATLPEVSLGRRSFMIERAPLVEAENIGIADGILGLDGLQGSRVLLDFENSEISVAEDRQSRSGYEIVVRARRREGQLIIATARLDGVRTAVVVDTGAQNSIGNAELLRRLRRARSFGNSEMTDINGVQQTGAIRIARELKIDRASLSNLAIVFADSPTFRLLGLEERPALLLGMSELRLFDRVAIDFRTREVLFDLPSNSGWPDFARNGN